MVDKVLLDSDIIDNHCPYDSCEVKIAWSVASFSPRRGQDATRPLSGKLQASRPYTTSPSQRTRQSLLSDHAQQFCRNKEIESALCPEMEPPNNGHIWDPVFSSHFFPI